MKVHSVEINCDGDERSIIAQIGKGFKFPDYFGQNWNAIDECITDLSWLPAQGYRCVLVGSKKLLQRDPRIHKLLLDTLNEAKEFWQKEGKQFVIEAS